MALHWDTAFVYLGTAAWHEGVDADVSATGW